MTLIERLSKYEDTIAGKIEARLGVHQRLASILFRIETITSVDGAIVSSYNDLHVSHPYISRVSDRQVGLTFSQVGAGVTVTKNDYRVILGRVPEINKFLEGTIAYFGNNKTSKRIDVYVNPTITCDQVASYDKKAYVLAVIDDDITRWELIIRSDYD
jgi:hypothetical protein